MAGSRVDIQKDCYKRILLNERLLVAAQPHRPRASLMNTLMQLRKCANHPYLFDGAALSIISTLCDTFIYGLLLLLLLFLYSVIIIISSSS